ncbi:MAG: hypothetical protein DWQ34_24815 [Planctomycetota bacterium]|nr:MAG: hypothetical protein DWQ29_14065 [Planctomycetota bacterium]REJ87500.1 MAG: hypothetical protein DWQ34_24815 [Planctomycetota bacterium]REK30615.1 MAG: hypothetical protein DWQ41_01290 [Planctomycetota bacterium]REK32989.1 MAG: hypothetical protein DWQ45_15390 [Planctomycetota bacterium]
MFLNDSFSQKLPVSLRRIGHATGLEDPSQPSRFASRIGEPTRAANEWVRPKSHDFGYFLRIVPLLTDAARFALIV